MFDQAPTEEYIEKLKKTFFARKFVTVMAPRGFMAAHTGCS